MKKIIILILVSMFIFTACDGGSKVDQNKQNEQNEQNEQVVDNVDQSKQVEQVVDTVVKAFTEADIQTLINNMEFNKIYDFEPTNTSNNLDVIYKYLNHEIISTNVDGDSAVVKVKITNVDFKVVDEIHLEKLSKAMIDNPELSDIELGELFFKLFKEVVDESKDETVSKTIDINMSKIDDKWIMKVDDDLVIAFSGGNLKGISK